jgi:serine/threonine-protein phosphatase 2A regulatory subunit A
MSDALLPIAILIDELKSDEPLRRLNSISRLSTIALALGEDRTRTELIPFLSGNIDDEDEVLLAEAEQLGSFVPYVGGPSHAYLLLPLLENLSTVDETIVRDKASLSLCMVGSQLPESAVCDHFAPLVKVSSRGPPGEALQSSRDACRMRERIRWGGGAARRGSWH